MEFSQKRKKREFKSPRKPIDEDKILELA